MIRERLLHAAQWMGGTLHGADAAFAGVSTDSRDAPAQSLFFALRGERVDGHDFVAAAATKGIACAVVERLVPAANVAQIVVADVRQALAGLATHWRRQLPAKVAAITGSNGKTTVKTLLASICAQAGRSAATRGNLNNEIGLPLTVLALDAEIEFAVLEMGAGKPGDIGYLAAIGQPDVSLVNNVGPAHLERLGSVEGVACTKAEIYDGLAEQGTGVVNADDAFAAYFRQVLGSRRRVEFGLSQPAQISAREIELGQSSRFILITPSGETAVELPLPGRHNVLNALAAAAVAYALGIDTQCVARGLAGAQGVSGRLSRHQAHGWTLLDDSYNANPASVKAGIEALLLEGGAAWVVLGDMRELGPREAELHAEMGRFAREQGVVRMFVVGALATHAAAAFGARAQAYPDRETLAADLARALTAGVSVLVKGSRSSGMDRVVDTVLATHGIEQRGQHHAA